MAPPRLSASRIPIATAVGIVFVLAYIVLAISLPDFMPPQPGAVQALYWCVAGMLWVLPVWALMLWAVRRR